MRAALTFQRKTPQRGATMIIALVLLAAMALLAVFAFKSSTGNLRIVHNSQLRQEAQAAAQTAVEATISTLDFVDKTAAVAASPVDVDVDGNGTPDYAVTVTPTCYRQRPKNVVTPSDVEKGCEAGKLDPSCPECPPSPPSCSDTEWNLRAQVDDVTTGVVAQINQGVTVTVKLEDVLTSCH